MRNRTVHPLVVVLVSALAAPASAQTPAAPSAAERHKEGHSKLGEAFDEGPRERPSKMDGIGRTHFRITTSIHATILIDKAGRMHWGRHGGGPFTDYEFLVSQLQRMNATQPPAVTSSTAAPR